MGVQHFLESFDPRPQILTEAFGASCVMAMIPSHMSPALERFQDIIHPSDIYDPANTESQYGLEKDFHVTIVFGVKSQDPDEVESLLAKQRPFTIVLGKTSIFENESYDVLKVTIDEAETLKKLNKEILEGTECDEQKWSYTPHMTLAYLKQGKGKDYSGHDQFEGVSVTIDKVEFSSSSGEKTVITLL
jgi:2'-5' RNA ligase